MMKRHTGLPRYRSTRRRSVYGVLAFSILALALTVSSADANYRWCRTDPVVVIDGRLADIFVSARFDDLEKVKGPTEIVVSTPVGVDAALAIATAGFGYGEKVRFAESESLEVTPEGIELRIKVRVPARDDAMPIRVEFAPHVVGVLQPVEAKGHANEWISLRSLL